MALHLAWSPAAIEDVEAIAAQIERDSPRHARAVASKLIAAAEAIPEFPELGQVVPEGGSAAIRERFGYSYRIIYRIEAQRIVLAAVVHGRRLQASLERIEG